MNDPCVKGILLRLPFEKIQGHLASGKLDDDSLAQWLCPEDLDLFDHGVHLAFWYPLDLYDRILAVLRDFEGAGDSAYCVRFGADSVQAITATPAARTVVDGARSFGSRSGVALVKLAELCFNFGQWSYEAGEDGAFTIETSGVARMPDSVRLMTQGFIGGLASQLSGTDVLCSSERVGRDRTVYRAEVI